MPKQYIGGTRPDYRIIDSDSHVNEHLIHHWKSFPKELQGLAPREFVDPAQTLDKDEVRNAQTGAYLKYDRTWVVEHSKLWPNADFRSGPDGRLPNPWAPQGEWVNRDGEREPDKRLQDMDHEGVDTTFIFGSASQNILCLIDNPEVALYWCKAWNDWAFRFCSHDPDRIRATALIPLHDVDAAVGELRRAITELGLGAAFLPAQFKTDWTWKEKYYPVFEECVRLNVPVSIHQNMVFGVGQRRLDNVFYKHIFMASDGPYSVVGFLASGVLETFPKLRVGWLEHGAGWLPYYLDRLHEHHKMFPGFVPPPKKDPRDYFGDQCFIAFEPEEVDYVPFLARKLGDAGIIFGTDYSHPDSISPRSVQKILDYPELSDGVKRKVLSDNPARFWGIRSNGA